MEIGYKGIFAELVFTNSRMFHVKHRKEAKMRINVEKIDSFIAKARDLFDAYIDVFIIKKNKHSYFDGKITINTRW